MSNLSLYSYGANIPHPEKAHRGGEDAYFISLPQTSAVGVADGVGGWANQGINPKDFADDLMAFALDDILAGETNPLIALNTSFKQVEQIGSCTAVIGIMNTKGKFEALNIGDSGFMIIRDEKIIFKTEEQQHGFNFPFQLGKVEGRDGKYYPHGQDRPHHGETYEIMLKEGDIIIFGSDGIFDNMWDKDILDLVNANSQDGPKRLSSILAKQAHEEAKRKDIWTPFAQRAYEDKSVNITKQNAKQWLGGKMDDITVVASYVYPYTQNLMAETNQSLNESKLNIGASPPMTMKKFQIGDRYNIQDDRYEQIKGVDEFYITIESRTPYYINFSHETHQTYTFNDGMLNRDKAFIRTDDDGNEYLILFPKEYDIIIYAK